MLLSMIASAEPLHAETAPQPRTRLPDRHSLAERLRELDHLGYTIIPGFLDLETTSRLRAYIDERIAQREPDAKARHHPLRHPMPGRILADMITDDHLALARAILRCDGGLRLLEQLMMRSDVGLEIPPAWHSDGVFYHRNRAAAPRQTYHFMWHVLSTVEPGGGGTMVVPRSQHLVYAATARIADPVEPIPVTEMDRLRAAARAIDGIHTSQGIEMCANEGDLIIIDPTCLHTASSNRGLRARYVFQQTFYHESAVELAGYLASRNYRGHFPDSLRQGLRPELRTLLDA